MEVADIFRAHSQDYRAKFGTRMPPSHLRVMRDIEQCRTPALGGQLFVCEKCGTNHYSYHSCKNRHCPKCQNDQANEWLENQKDLLLPVPYFLVTFTLPEELRRVARSHQEILYNILFHSSSEALQLLAADKRFIGGRIAMVGVLHTWTRDLRYHPHIHYIVAGGGLTADNKWVASREGFLVHVKPLSVLFRAKFRDLLKKTNLFSLVPKAVWKKDWVVHSEPVGSGQEVFRYLAPYIFRVAISNNRILALEDGVVTFQYKESATDKIKITKVTAQEFIRRFLQHVLPYRFVKVRYYGLLSPANKHLLEKARLQLTASAPPSKAKSKDLNVKEEKQPLLCPNCGNVLVLVGPLKPFYFLMPHTREPP